MSFSLPSRRATYLDISEETEAGRYPLSEEEVAIFEEFDLTYRALCAILFNYVPTSGHPGGSISSGRFVQGLLFDAMAYDVADPDRSDADVISYAAGHKALGLYALWALRNEIVRIATPADLPENLALQLRLEDLLGFRRNPVNENPLFLRFCSKALDGHPTPATPFVRLSTGASGVGVASSMGLAFGAKDYFGARAPCVHIVEGEGGLTPGRVFESLAAVGTASLDNVVLHVDWNQASIDSNRVCREGEQPGDYVQWTPQELAYLHDWNVIDVPDGTDFQQIVAAQRTAAEFGNGQPTAIVYRTTKGWNYGIEGKASHGAGHELCSPGFFEATASFVDRTGASLPRCLEREKRCNGATEAMVVEDCFWEALQAVRRTLERNRPLVEHMAERLLAARRRLDETGRKPRENAPNIDHLYELVDHPNDEIPRELVLEPGTDATLRGALGKCLGFLNRASNGAILAAAADLLGSTSIGLSGDGFPAGYFNARSNPDARLLSVGGICEDAMSGIISGLSSYGHHIGAGASYGAFIGALGHISARLHAIGGQARQAIREEPFGPFFLVCAHAGLKTGEDGPTHADPQPLQLLQGNFPRGTMITLTPWDPQELWPLVKEALRKRPAVIAPFITRPMETVLDRTQGLPPANSAAKGVYALKRWAGKSDGSVVLQGSEVTYAFLQTAWPLLQREGVHLDVFYVASAELFDLLPDTEKEHIFPDRLAQQAMGITGFTLPTMYRWIRSEYGLSNTMHPFQYGRFLGSGPGSIVLKEAGLDGERQFRNVMEYVEGTAKRSKTVFEH